MQAPEKFETDPRTGSEWVLLPASEFRRGLAEEEDASPVQAVRVSGFWISRTEVTREHYARYMAATSRPEPAHWKHELFMRPGSPVVGVTWQDAVDFATWAGGRLPTEAEWEYAARGADFRRYPWGSEPPDRTRAIHHQDIGFGGTQPAGATTAAGRSPFGLLDMAGNAQEWCADWYAADYYARAPRENPTGPPAGKQRVVRGGSWISLPDALRCGAREKFPPEKSSVLIGFRVARPVV